MKHLKKLAGVLLALVMVMALAAPAFASNNTGSIKITNAAPGQQYTVYKLFDLAYGGTADEDEDAPHTYSIASNSPWLDFVTGTGSGTAYVTVDSQNYVTWKEGADPAEFAKLALQYAQTKSIAFTQQKTAPEATGEATSVELSFTDLPLGYYLIDSSMGALCSLDSTNRNVEVTEKNEKPTIKKETTNNTENTQRVGEDIEYSVTVHAKQGAVKYVLTDTMGTGLKFNKDIEVKVGDTALTKDTDYTVTSETDSGFTLSFTDTYLNSIGEDGVDIVVSYSAKITAEAITVDELTNTAKLKFGDPDHTEETEPSEVKSKVFKFDFIKHNSNNEPLAGAVFSLHTGNPCNDGNRLGLVALETDNSYRVATDEDATEDIVYTVTTPADGKITIDGLGNTTYYLNEVTPPTGYNALKEPVSVAFNGADITTAYDANSTAEDKWTGVHVLNLTGAELPETGGIGTTIFYIVGGVLAVGAVVVLIAKRRTGSDEE